MKTFWLHCGNVFNGVALAEQDAVGDAFFFAGDGGADGARLVAFRQYDAFDLGARFLDQLVAESRRRELGGFRQAKGGRDSAGVQVFGNGFDDQAHAFDVVTGQSPAHSGEGSARDLAVFARELAAPRLVGADPAAEATSVAFPGLDGVLPGYGRQAPNDFGLGVEVRGHKHPHWTGRAGSPTTFGHFGQSGSFIWVDPEARRQAVFPSKIGRASCRERV